mgnify:CR=1 FL=1
MSKYAAMGVTARSKALSHFWRLAAPVRGHLALSLLLACMAGLANFGLLFLSGWLLAGAAAAGLAGQAAARAFNIVLPATGVRFFAMVRIGTRYLERVVTHDGALRLTSLLRSWTYSRLAPQAPAGLVDARGGDLLGRFVAETDQITGWYTDAAIPTLRALLCGIVFVVVFACVLPMAAFVLACGLAVAALLVWALTAPVTTRLAARSVNERAGLQATMAETLQNLGENLTLGAMPARYAAMAKQQQGLNAVHRRLAVMERLAAGGVTLAMFVTAFAVLVCAAQALQAGVLDAPELPMLVLGVLAAFDVISALPTARLAAARAQVAADRLTQRCGDPEQDQGTTAPAQPQAPYDLVLDAVSFRYPGADVPVFDRVSLSIRQGERVAIVGPSGAGKSSLINLLFGFWQPQAGHVLCGGVDVQTTDAESLSRFISVAAQDSYLFAGSMRDNLRLANPDATQAEMLAALQTACLGTFVASLPDGLDTLLGNEGLRLSGGQARRLSIAQALLRPAPWLVLDEPTQGLDAATAQALMAALLRARPEATIVCMTHSQDVQACMHRVLRVEGGRVWPEGGADMKS